MALLQKTRILAPILAIFLSVNAYSQSVKAEDIVSHPEMYICAYGEGATDSEAIESANAKISAEISTSISSKFSYSNATSSEGAGKPQTERNVDIIIDTYSSNTLLDCRTIYISKRPGKYKVLKYMERTTLERIFEERMTKAREMVDVAVRAEEELKIDDALRYYYWALLVVNTLPVPSECKYYYEREGRMCPLSAWIPGRIDSILSSLDVKYQGRSKDDPNLAVLSFTSGGRNVSSITYSCDIGGTWTDLVSARNGLGTVDLTGLEDAPYIAVNVEYAFENMSANDLQVKNIFKHIDRPYFQKAALPKLKLNTRKAGNAVVESHTTVEVGTNSEFKVSDAGEQKRLQGVVYRIADALKTKDYDSVREFFTEDGLKEYELLMKYGNARVVLRPELKFIRFGDELYGRSIPMKFSFGGKEFVENVVFLFDKDRKISSVAFAIEDETIRSIAEHDWDERAKVTLINFLEAYRTSFALKNINYIESIFSEDALIIVGRVLQRVAGDTQMSNLSTEQIVYNKMNKETYVNNLRNSFAGKEYINIKFSNATIGHYNKGNNDYIFGIQIKQDYYSSNYADSGYLYLFVDLEDKDRPMIHIRTWQPKPDPEFGLFGPNNI